MGHRNIYTGLVYSRFDEKAGPIAVHWRPSNMDREMLSKIADHALYIIDGNARGQPEPLSFVALPSFAMKIAIKGFRIPDLTRRGHAKDAAISIVFSERDDPVFYKFREQFETFMNELSTVLIDMEERGVDKKLIKERIDVYHQRLAILIDDLSIQERAESSNVFPRENAEEDVEDEFVYKVVIIGDPGVGKTSTVLRVTDHAFKTTYIPTIGVNISEKVIKHPANDHKIKLVLWDIAGQAKFGSMRKHFYDGAQGVVLMFDLTQTDSFHEVEKWYNDIHSHVGDCPTVVLGNKVDLASEREVTDDMISGSFFTKLEIPFFTTSAHTGENLIEPLLDLVRRIQPSPNESR